jgi:hypothetical protein
MAGARLMQALDVFTWQAIFEPQRKQYNRRYHRRLIQQAACMTPKTYESMVKPFRKRLHIWASLGAS